MPVPVRLVLSGRNERGAGKISRGGGWGGVGAAFSGSSRASLAPRVSGRLKFPHSANVLAGIKPASGLTQVGQ
ncbi:hypothetical protein PCL1606_20950 [Pseudomonas chlororaphis]|uniref:Uncharacterized protein n=1 Tax=Pseudomonas chlororaphis TaxID=587753 RepID=A0A0D5XWS6_9PSED|nr:hypothetical protein PCL1606_20950 [Pseudomonas chlororaphis]